MFRGMLTNQSRQCLTSPLSPSAGVWREGSRSGDKESARSSMSDQCICSQNQQHV